ncbi:endoribonuclease ZC3H12A-like [Amphiura filiformis]|uniref:endoribonuclease ZC3H12A-like n=1 Tax=Amphiura filiformis TaxID=82378 RepID=UPI003B20C6AA
MFTNDTDIDYKRTSSLEATHQESHPPVTRALVAHGCIGQSTKQATVVQEPCTPSDYTIDSESSNIKRQVSVDRNRTKVYDQKEETLNDPVDIMQKLGYSRNDVEQIMQQLGPNASTNDILGCLVSQSKSTASDVVKHEAREIATDVQEPRISDFSDSSSVHVPPVIIKDDADNLRTIIIDGSNVAMSYGNKDVFACKGIEIVVNWFLERGHREIFVFVPNWRKEAAKPDTPITDQQILEKLNKLGILVFTPSRRIGGRRIVCYDDRYIIKTAVEYDGIVVSNDNFRDLQSEQPEFKKVIEERLLMYSFVGKQFMPPDDPLGRHGPSLDNLLRKRPTAPDHPPQACPYGKKCTYGNKCKYYHPERPAIKSPPVKN